MRTFAIIAALMSGLFLSTAAGAEGGFVVDMEKEDIRRLDGRRYVSDLPIGGEGELSYFRGCVENGTLLLAQRTELRDKPSFNIRVLARRVSADGVAIEFRPTEDASPKDVHRRIANFPAWDCEQFFRENKAEPTFRLLSINGATRFSDLLKTQPFAGALPSQ